MNFFDKSISFFSPAAALRRARARAALRRVELSYEAAQVGRRTSGWRSGAGSANAEIAIDLKILRERCREECRNNAFAAKAGLEFVNKVVRDGINPRAPAPALSLWNRWDRECSADGLPNFAAVEALVVRTMYESGEAIVRRRTRTSSVAAGMSVPIQLQVMEPDQLDLSKTLSLKDGYIIQGVEFNSWGQRRAYWLFPQHPGEVVLTGGVQSALVSAPVPASEILHIRDVTIMRPNQVRGVPWLAPVLMTMRDLADWEDSELLRKKTETCLAAIVVDPDGTSNPDGKTIAPWITDSLGNKIEEWQPGMIGYGGAGFDVKFNQPAYAGGYSDYKRSRVRDLATGIGLLYEILAGDLSQTNYSSYRSGLLSLRDRILTLQWVVMVPLLCDPVWNWFLSAAQDFAGLPKGNYPVEWGPPPFDLLDREAEAKADALELQLGKTTWPQLVSSQGEDPEQQISEIEAWQQRLKAAGVDFGTKAVAPVQAPAQPQ